MFIIIFRKAFMKESSQGREVGFRTWTGRDGLQGFSGIPGRGSEGSHTGRRQKDPVLEKQCHLVWLEQRVDDGT